MKEALLRISAREALVIALLIIAVMSATMIGFGWVPHISIILVLCGLLGYGKFKGQGFAAMEAKMAEGVMLGIGAIYLFFFIGLLVSALMMSGAIPTLMYYGFDLISPQLFYLSAFILCSVIGIALGSGFTTCATAGVAFLGMAEAFEANPAIVAGAVVSGALFGDKMSPLSETTNLTPAAAEIGLWEHIKGMLPTTVPAMLIALGLYAWLGYGYSTSGVDMALIQQVQDTMAANYKLSLITLLPAVVVIAAAMMKMPAMPTVYAGVVVAAAVAFLVQGSTVPELFNVLQNGVVSATGFEVVDKLLSKGGVMSMTWVVTLTLFALGFVGALEYYGTLRSVMNKINHLIRSRFGLVGATYTSVLGTGVLVGDVYTTLVLPARLMKDKYEELGYKKTTLTRSIEDCGTLLSPLIPWNMGGSFIAATLGAATFAYAPYAFACWLSPLIGLVWVITGKFIPKVSPQERRRRPPKWQGL